MSKTMKINLIIAFLVVAVGLFIRHGLLLILAVAVWSIPFVAFAIVNKNKKHRIV